MRRRLLVTVTNYLGSTQFYLTITHQRILIVVVILAALSLLVGNGVLVWLSRSHTSVLQQAETWRLADHQSQDKILKLQSSLAKLVPPSKSAIASVDDFQQLLKIAPAAAVTLEQLHAKTRDDYFTIRALEGRLSELAHSQYELQQQLAQSQNEVSLQSKRYLQKSSTMEQSLRQLQWLLGEQVDGTFDLP